MEDSSRDGNKDHPTCLLRNLYAGQEATVRTRHRTMDWFQIGEEYIKVAYCHPAYLSYMHSTSWEMLGWMNPGIRIAGRNINNLRYTDDTILMAESEEELNSLLMNVKQESEKAGLNSTFKKLRSWHPVPFTSWQIDVETIEPVTDFIFLGSKITADGDCSHEIKRHLLLGRKSMTNLDGILKSRYITLPPKIQIANLVVMYGCESWTIKKTEC